MSIIDGNWPPKRAGEKDYRGIDWKNDLASGETISAWDFTSDGVTVDSTTKDATRPITIVTLSGGTAGATAEVIGTITTSLGRELEAAVQIAIN